jgi:hypothetical protein
MSKFAFNLATHHFLRGARVATMADTASEPSIPLPVARSVTTGRHRANTGKRKAWYWYWFEEDSSGMSSWSVDTFPNDFQINVVFRQGKSIVSLKGAKGVLPVITMTFTTI